MKRILTLTTILVTLMLSKNSAYTQTFDSIRCETVTIDSTTFFNWPYFGNNQYLLNLVDSVEGNNPNARYIPAVLRIPVTAWVYHLSATFNDNITNNVVEQYINSINQFYVNNSVNIRLYLRCSITHLVDNTFYNGVNASNTDNLFNNHYAPRTLNIHFTNGSDGFARGRFPWKTNPYACYIPTAFNIFGNVLLGQRANSLTHEVGHSLGLIHTHEGSRGGKTNNALCGDCYQESVSRTRTQGAVCISTLGKKKCEVNADCLCDTDGDPLLQNISTGEIYVLPGCAGYDRTNSPYKQDRWGANWLPVGNENAILNIMSYSSPACRTVMTPMQRGVEYFYALNKGVAPFPANYTSFYQNDDVDNFENDNFSQNANLLSLFTPQQHSFHLVPDASSIYSGCDIDWVRFTPACGGTLSISTAFVAGRPSADTRLTLFSQALAQLAQNDNISTTNKYSKISFNFTAGTTYLLRVENMTPNTVGYYSITAGDNTISGSDLLCTPSTYSFPDLPSGATVQWTSNPAGAVTFSPSNAKTTTATKVSSGSITITATVNCNGNIYTSSKSIRAGGYSSSDYPVSGPSSVCKNTYVTYTTNTLPGATSYTWFYPGGGTWTYVSGQNTPSLTLITGSSTGNYQVGVRVANACDAGGSYAVANTYVNSCGSFAAKISPNPSNGEITISTVKENLKTFSPDKIFKIRVVDQLGVTKKVYQLTGSQITKINLSTLPKGIYQLALFNGKQWISKKLVLQ